MSVLVVTENEHLKELAIECGAQWSANPPSDVYADADMILLGADKLAGEWNPRSGVLVVGFDVNELDTLEAEAVAAGADGLAFLTDPEHEQGIRQILRRENLGPVPSDTGLMPCVGDPVAYHGSQGDVKLAFVLCTKGSVTPGTQLPELEGEELHLAVIPPLGHAYNVFKVKRADGTKNRPCWTTDRP